MAPHNRRSVQEQVSIADWYKRWRHGHGFGVHSPFAYRMVREVLRPSRATAYYAYGELSSARRRCGSTLSKAEVELIYRILIALRPATVAISADSSRELLAEVVCRALPHSTIVEGSADMLLCEGIEDCQGSYPSAYFTHSANPTAARMWASATHGHKYHNPHRTLIASRPIPKQEIAIKF